MEFFSQSIEKLFEKYTQLKLEYKLDGKPQYCLEIAKEFKKILAQEGYEPQIYIVGMFFENGEWKNLKPKFDTDISWGLHCVCECGGFIFDPIFSQPIEKEKYTTLLFGKNLTLLKSNL